MRNRITTWVLAAAAAGAVAATTTPAQADVKPGDSAQWGTVVKDGGCSQAHAWVGRARGLFGLIDAPVFQTHSPPLKDAPEERGITRDLVNLPGLGVASGFFDRALTGRLPGNPGQPDKIKLPCSAYAEAGGGSIDAGIPYLANPIPGKPQLSPIGFHLEGIVVEARSVPGQPVAFKGDVAGGYISTFGTKIIDIPLSWPRNFGMRIPADYNQPVLGLATTNEQVTTGPDGSPTTDASGKYFYDPTATSGYVNAMHASILGTSAADVSIGHAAVLRGGDKSELPPCATPGARCATRG